MRWNRREIELKNCLRVNLKNDETVIKIHEEAQFDEIMQRMKTKMEDLKVFYKEEKTPIVITGKVLKIKEIEELEGLIKSIIDVKITFDSPKTLGLHSIKKAYEKPADISETKFYKGSLRSGKRIEFEGSIVIMGDVNAGAEVIAVENIVVVGCLRGLAHAGAKGNTKVRISACSIESPQIRIANLVKDNMKEDCSNKKIKYACIKDDEIVVE